MPIVKVRLPEVPMALLRQLHATGLYGNTIEETAERVICEELRNLIREDDLLLSLKPPKKSRRRKE